LYRRFVGRWFLWRTRFKHGLLAFRPSCLLYFPLEKILSELTSGHGEAMMQNELPKWNFDGSVW
jgi:hypothetical protein